VWTFHVLVHIVQRVKFDVFTDLYNNCNLENIYGGMDNNITVVWDLEVIGGGLAHPTGYVIIKSSPEIIIVIFILCY